MNIFLIIATIVSIVRDIAQVIFGSKNKIAVQYLHTYINCSKGALLKVKKRKKVNFFNSLLYSRSAKFYKISIALCAGSDEILPFIF